MRTLVIFVTALLAACQTTTGGTPSAGGYSDQIPVVSGQQLPPAPTAMGAAPASATPTASALPTSTPRPQSGWFPWFAKKANMGQQEFATALAGGSKLRVNWRVYRKSLAALGLPVGNTLTSLQQFLMSPQVTVMNCSTAILSGYTMGRTDQSGRITDFGYPRTRCYQGEQLLVYRPTGQVFLSLGCGNVMRPNVPQTPAPQLLPPQAAYPSGVQVICPPEN